MTKIKYYSCYNFRDLKSKNVVIASAKRIAKICDFGSSRELNKTVTKFSRLHGTVAWMAPEVLATVSSSMNRHYHLSNSLFLVHYEARTKTQCI